MLLYFNSVIIQSMKRYKIYKEKNLKNNLSVI